MDCRPPVSSVHGTFQARILEWGAVSPPVVLPHPGIGPKSLATPALADSLPPGSLLKPCMSCSNYHFHSQTEAIAILKYAYNFALILHIAFAEKKKITLLVYVVFCML